MGCGGAGSRNPNDDPVELEKQLHHPEPTQQAVAARRLARLGPEARSALPALIEVLSSKSALVRESALTALARIGTDAKEAIPAITRSLEDVEYPVRVQAINALGQMGPEAGSARKQLQHLVKYDPIPQVREAATKLLKKLDSDQPAANPPKDAADR
jgi:HEAT repeat protein